VLLSLAQAIRSRGSTSLSQLKSDGLLSYGAVFSRVRVPKSSFLIVKEHLRVPSLGLKYTNMSILVIVKFHSFKFLAWDRYQPDKLSYI